MTGQPEGLALAQQGPRAPARTRPSPRVMERSKCPSPGWGTALWPWSEVSHGHTVKSSDLESRRWCPKLRLECLPTGSKDPGKRGQTHPGFCPVPSMPRSLGRTFTPRMKRAVWKSSLFKPEAGEGLCRVRATARKEGERVSFPGHPKSRVRMHQETLVMHNRNPRGEGTLQDSRARPYVRPLGEPREMRWLELA